MSYILQGPSRTAGSHSRSSTSNYANACQYYSIDAAILDYQMSQLFSLQIRMGRLQQTPRR
jgi:hypothetical protein